MLVEQAIFTSLKTRRQEGYQLAATSPGVGSDVARELALWGPAHDSLILNDFGSSSVNFHPLDSGDFCISKTTASGEEYSGRGGPRIYTQMLVVPPAALLRFANNPLALIDAVTASGQLAIYEHPPLALEPIQLVGRAAVVNQLRLAELAGDPGIEALVLLLQLANTSQRLAVRSHVPLERLFSGLLMLLPLHCRTQLSFTTGLRYSPRRPFHLLVLPPDRSEQRNLQRTSSATPLDLTRDPPPLLDKLRLGWAYLIRDVLRTRQFAVLPELLRRAHRYADEALKLDEIAQRVEADVHAGVG
jgi:hypothetical protein